MSKQVAYIRVHGAYLLEIYLKHYNNYTTGQEIYFTINETLNDAIDVSLVHVLTIITGHFIR